MERVGVGARGVGVRGVGVRGDSGGKGRGNGNACYLPKILAPNLHLMHSPKIPRSTCLYCVLDLDECTETEGS